MGWSIVDLFKGHSKQKEEFDDFTELNSESGSYKDFKRKLTKGSLIILILGKRGSGKTVLGMRLLELVRNDTKKKCYVMGYEKTKLPMWIKKSKDIESIPNNSVALIDEGAIVFSSRESMKKPNKALGNIMAIARHKNLTLILITQNSAMVDVNVLRLADSLLLKEPSLLQSKFERKGLKEIYEKVIPEFEGKENKKKLFYIYDDDFMGLMESPLPSFWNEKISKSFR